MGNGRVRQPKAYRTKWRYTGGPAITYPETVDGSRLFRGSAADGIAAIEEFARGLLRDLGMPDRDGRYARTADGAWRSIPADPTEESLRDLQTDDIWPLWTYVEKYCDDPLGAKAAEVVVYAEQLRAAVAQNDIEVAVRCALTFALQADALALEREFRPDLVAGQQLRLGGLKGREAAGVDREVHEAWLARDLELATQHPELSDTKRARIIAREHGATTKKDVERLTETIRKRVRKMKESGKGAS